MTATDAGHLARSGEEGAVRAPGDGPVGAEVLREVLRTVEERTPQGIAATLSRLVHDGTVVPGSRLPTVRAVAAALGVSPATVSSAWRALAAVGLLTSRGRAGSYVREPAEPWLPPRYRDLARTGGDVHLDLSTGTPDPDLLPPLGAVLGSLGPRTPTTSYLDAPVLVPLERHLRSTWPYPVESLTVVDGAFDALSRSLELVVRFGDRVVVEDPCFPPLLDLLEQLGARAVPAAVDDDGLVPDALAQALRTGPVAVVLQPRAHNPTGASLTARRARGLARLLRDVPGGHDVVVVEDDHTGDVASAPDVSLGTHLPAQVLHVRSYSKSHGPDLRIAALGGPSSLVDRVVARRMLGPGWTSRMLQAVLLELLTSETGSAAVATARAVYARRQRDLADAMATHGVHVRPGDGINLWLPVASERAALVHLAALGVRVAPGTPFRSGPDGGRPHVRVTAGLVRDDPGRVGAALAAASRAPGSGAGSTARGSRAGGTL